MRTQYKTRVLVTLTAFATATAAMAQVEVPVLSSGGTVFNDGTIGMLGQFSIGLTGTGPRETHQGAIPCWPTGVECPGDLDGDLTVGISDLTTLLSNFGTPGGATMQEGDLDGDGDVDITDLAALLSVFGAVC